LILGQWLFAGSAAADQDHALVVTAEEIQAMKTVRLSDVLNQLPGVSAGDSSVAIYGSYKVKVLVDGRPINDPTSSHGGVKWDMIPIETIEKIEILRGKGSLKYGDDAGGGVILITTRKIQRLTGNLRFHAGNYGTWSGNMNIGKNVGRMDVALSASCDTTSGYLTNNDKKKKRTGMKLTYSPSKKQGYTLSGDFLDENYGLAGPRDYPTPYSRVKSQIAAMALLAQIEGITSRTFFTRGQRRNSDISKGLDQTLIIQKAGQELDSSIQLGRLGGLDFGAGFTWDKASGTTLENRDENALFAFAKQVSPLGALPVEVSLGVRVSWYSEFDCSANPEIKVSWDREVWQVHLSYARANNVPSFHQRYNQTSSTMPNPDLRMETSDNYSIALFFKPLNRISVTSSLFYNEITDRITYVRNVGVGQYVNFGRVTYRGFDLSCDWKILGSLIAKGTYTHLSARDEETGRWVPAKPRHKGSIEMRYAPLRELSLVTDLIYRSSVYSDSANTKKIPGYWFANLRGEYRLGKFSLYGEIKNMLNKDYSYADGVAAPPLTWILGVSYTI